MYLHRTHHMIGVCPSFTCYPLTTISAFTPQPQGITALWLVLSAPTHRGMARLSWPGWLVIYCYRFSHTRSWTLDTVTRPTTNWAWHRVTSLIETMHYHYAKPSKQQNFPPGYFNQRVVTVSARDYPLSRYQSILLGECSRLSQPSWLLGAL